MHKEIVLLWTICYFFLTLLVIVKVLLLLATKGLISLSVLTTIHENCTVWNFAYFSFAIVSGNMYAVHVLIRQYELMSTLKDRFFLACAFLVPFIASDLASFALNVVFFEAIMILFLVILFHVSLILTVSGIAFGAL